MWDADHIMCGRYQLTLAAGTLAGLLDAQLGATAPLARASWDASPTQVLPVIVAASASTTGRVLEAARWGFVPPWSSGRGRPLINARAETVLDKRSFRDAVRTRRVLVPVTGFYEWSGVPGSKVRHLIRARGAAVDPITGEVLDHEASREEVVAPFLLAAFAYPARAAAGARADAEDTGDDPTGSLDSFVILTTEPNEVCRPIHDRMPVIVPRAAADAWLREPPDATEHLLDELATWPARDTESWPYEPMVSDDSDGQMQLGSP